MPPGAVGGGSVTARYSHQPAGQHTLLSLEATATLTTKGMDNVDHHCG